MKRQSIINIIGVMVLLLLASCGKQYQAEQTVKDFVDANMESADLISDRDFADIGTTRHISDSLITVMHKRGAQFYKKDINYPQTPQGELYYLRMKYIYNGDSLQNTFYLNEELTEVIAFK